MSAGHTFGLASRVPAAAAALLAALLACPGVSGCHRAPPPRAAGNGAPTPASSQPRPKLPEFEVKAVSERKGTATWYEVPEQSLADRRAWEEEMTAASDSIPPNTYVRVRRLENGKTVIVRITDHGIHRAGTLIDLSKSAAEALGMVRAGTSRVRLEVLALKNADVAGPPTKPAASGEPTPPRKLNFPAATKSDEANAAAAKPANAQASP